MGSVKQIQGVQKRAQLYVSLILNPKESENGFWVSLLNRSIQDISDHGTSKEPKNPLPDRILRFL